LVGKDIAQLLFPQRAGFTLAEMLIVMVIIAVLAGGVVVSLQGRHDDYALQMAAKDLAAALNCAISRSKLRSVPHRLAFYDNMKGYRVEAVRAGTPVDFSPVEGRAGILKNLPEGVEITTVLFDGQQIDRLPESFEFASNGEGFSGLIELKNRAEQVRRIRVAAKTGQVHVIE
jgi:prepilin-type N-terminal cleavage/methylation domain-containing protein